MKRRTKFIFLLVGMAIGLTLSALLGSGPDPVGLDQQQYCEMVALNRADPTVGWPDYNDNYDEVCGNAQGSR